MGCSLIHNFEPESVGYFQSMKTAQLQVPPDSDRDVALPERSVDIKRRQVMILLATNDMNLICKAVQL
jgi:hypothetical protein